jgi:hypothetical protein
VLGAHLVDALGLGVVLREGAAIAAVDLEKVVDHGLQVQLPWLASLCARPKCVT